MKKLTLLALLFMAMGTMCNAQKIWSVSKDAAQKANFSEIQDAIDAASPGDYIYVYPSVYENGFILGKRLILVGPGFFLGDNPNTQVNKSPANIKGESLIGANSTGTVITGLTFGNLITVQNTSDIMIKRNWINSLQIKGSTSITVKQNYIDGYSITDVSAIDYAAVYVGANSSNINILNNFLQTKEKDWYRTKIAAILTIQNNTVSCLLKNNIIDGNLWGYNITFENNILIGGGDGGCTTSSFKNNIAVNTTFGTTNGNQSNVASSTIFVGSTVNQSTDGRWQLKNISPAKGAGLEGVDCGMFGGPDPYVLSGIPDIPAIYFFQAPDVGSSSNGLPVHLKIKSHQ